MGSLYERLLSQGEARGRQEGRCETWDSAAAFMKEKRHPHRAADCKVQEFPAGDRGITLLWLAIVVGGVGPRIPAHQELVIDHDISEQWSCVLDGVILFPEEQGQCA